MYQLNSYHNIKLDNGIYICIKNLSIKITASLQTYVIVCHLTKLELKHYPIFKFKLLSTGY